MRQFFPLLNRVNLGYTRNNLSGSSKIIFGDASRYGITSFNDNKIANVSNRLLGLTLNEAKWSAQHISKSLSAVPSTPILIVPSYKKIENMKLPTLHKIEKREPITSILEKFDPFVGYAIEDPRKVIEIEASKIPFILQIRRRKMKKHKSKKYERKNKYKVKHEKILKEAKREKEFQKAQMELLMEAQKFSAEDYVKRTIEDAYYEKPAYVHDPRTHKGYLKRVARQRNIRSYVVPEDQVPR